MNSVNVAPLPANPEIELGVLAGRHAVKVEPLRFGGKMKLPPTSSEKVDVKAISASEETRSVECRSAREAPQKMYEAVPTAKSATQIEARRRVCVLDTYIFGSACYSPAAFNRGYDAPKTAGETFYHAGRIGRLLKKYRTN